MATVIRLVDDLDEMDEEQVAAHWLTTVADDDVLACRGAGRHNFDRFRRGRKRMRNTWAVPAPAPAKPGCFLLVQRCPDCRMVTRALLTAPSGAIDLPAKWKYWRDPRYSPPKSGVTGHRPRISPRVALQESARRMNEEGWIGEAAAVAPPPDILALVLAAS